ncbi:nuclear transport factor 2 family protein [Nocardia sp. alder85J]|uniref:nuclear transport factor 2 family protein n=1 Tax=Nocardia sp. alder85J TaxID=2862949 RepID=UPI001CD7F8AB|nr:nuclear transport factor 2 family protein [Nocardia sp. alder85J]MCX4091842.1 nuclear transport factor 2 family protein [Nocardia sp. alder85J]
MSAITAVDVLDRRRQLTLAGDVDGLAELYALDAVIESPFAGVPVRLEGREAIREYTRRVVDSPLRLDDYEIVELYRTEDPEVVVVELRASGTLTTTGRSFATTSIQVLRIRDGHIVLFRDYANPRVLEEFAADPPPEG